MTGKTRGFRRVLDLCDQLSEIRERMGRRKAAPGEAGAGLLKERRDRLGELWAELPAAFARGVLGELSEKFDLKPEELFVIALLLSHRIRKGDRGLSGRAVLSMIHESVYDMVRGMEILGAEGSLRRAGIVVACEPYGADVFESTFRLTDSTFYLLLDEIGGRGADAEGPPARKPYVSPREHLLDMGRLGALYRKRASMLFPVEAQDFFDLEGELALDEIEYRIDAGWDDIEQRLLLTPRYEEYPLVRLERTYTLSRREIIIVVSLFFVELISPAPYLVVGDLLKLVSRDENDLMSMRQLLQEDSSLVKSGIIILDGEHGVHRKITTFDAYLADWVVDRLAGPSPDLSAITSDMQIDVHEFLKGLSRPPGSD